jgi:hypothetical protein
MYLCPVGEEAAIGALGQPIQQLGPTAGQRAEQVGEHPQDGAGGQMNRGLLLEASR